MPCKTPLWDRFFCTWFWGLKTAMSASCRAQKNSSGPLGRFNPSDSESYLRCSPAKEARIQLYYYRGHQFFQLDPAFRFLKHNQFCLENLHFSQTVAVIGIADKYRTRWRSHRRGPGKASRGLVRKRRQSFQSPP